MLALILTNVGIIIANALVLVFKTTGKAYFEEKGKNLATKQDIREITTEVEAVKNELALKKDLQFSITNLQINAIIDYYDKLIVALSNMNFSLLYAATLDKLEVLKEIESNVKESSYQFQISTHKLRLYMDDPDLEQTLGEFESRLLFYQVGFQKAKIEIELQGKLINTQSSDEMTKMKTFHNLMDSVIKPELPKILLPDNVYVISREIRVKLRAKLVSLSTNKNAARNK